MKIQMLSFHAFALFKRLKQLSFLKIWVYYMPRAPTKATLFFKDLSILYATSSNSRTNSTTFLVICHLDNFDDLIQSGFWVVPKTTFANFYKLIHDFIIISVSSDPLNMGTVEKKEKKLQKHEVLENEKRFL